METAKSTISSLLGRSGKQDTEIDESVNAPVTSEVVKPHRHEETIEAVDKEVHKHHYHTTVQPLAQKEVLPEQHIHNLAPQVERTIHHGDIEQDRSKAASELGQFQNTSTVAPTSYSAEAAPRAVGEHVHHHVHETVQPIIHKETVQPEVIHTTIPIHEKHVAPSEHHGMSVLPTKTLDEVKSMGNVLGGASHSVKEYEGHPKPYASELQPHPHPIDVNPIAHEGPHDPAKTGHFSKSDDIDHYDGIRPDTGVGVVSGTPIAVGSLGTHHDTQGTQAPLRSSGPVGSNAGADLGLGHNTQSLGEQSDHRHGPGALTGATAGAGLGGAAAGAAYHHDRDDTATRDSDTLGTLGSGVGHSGTATGVAPIHDHTTSTRDSGALGTTGSGIDHSTTTTTTTTTSTSHGLTGQHDTSRDNMNEDLRGSTRKAELEPTNLTGGAAALHGTTRLDDDVQHASRQGEDPSLEKDERAKAGKLVGTGVDGSHSAVFGLTPDGHKCDDTKSALKDLTPAHHDVDKDKESKEYSNTSGAGSAAIEDGQGTMRKEGNEGIAEQMRDLKVNEPAHAGKGSYQPGDTTKPGAGIGL